VQYQLYVWRVDLNPAGRPVWTLHRRGYWCRNYNSDKVMIGMCRKRGEPGVPFMQDAGPGKLVTMKQAERLTGLLAPAAMDRLTETVNDSPTLSNYVKPAKAKAEEPPPEAKATRTRVDIARQKHQRALNKVTQWYEAIAHAEAKHKEWRQKARLVDVGRETVDGQRATVGAAVRHLRHAHRGPGEVRGVGDEANSNEGDEAMKKDLRGGTWKVLRALVRDGELSGKDLRYYDYGRRTQDGAFLDELCSLGLIEPTGATIEAADGKMARKSPQFRRIYRLTDAGRFAAEYGEYEYQPVRPAPARKPAARTKARGK
jgi:hypothetical protein